VDGGLIGGASLNARDFLDVIKACVFKKNSNLVPPGFQFWKQHVPIDNITAAMRSPSERKARIIFYPAEGTGTCNPLEEQKAP
jgi:hypothetical protein